MKEGRIIIEQGANVWPHELKTAKAFAAQGQDVVFPLEDNETYRASFDAIIYGIEWEMKAPRSPKIEKVFKVLREALHQSTNIIYDSQRIKKLSDMQIEKELRRLGPKMPSMKNLIFVNRKREIIVIKQARKFDKGM